MKTIIYYCYTLKKKKNLELKTKKKKRKPPNLREETCLTNIYLLHNKNK